jgi:predicted nucleotide-binding protein (sugar kinase/HSP70/actin superfamily)
MSYPEVIKNNMDILKTNKIKFMNPFLPVYNYEKLLERLCIEFEYFGVSAQEVESALDDAWAEDLNVKEDIRKKGEETLEYINKKGIQGIVLGGRPYHVDPEINHGIPEMITRFGIAVFSHPSSLFSLSSIVTFLGGFLIVF